MSLLNEHLSFYREIFKIEGFFSEPFLMLGYQDISKLGMPGDFNYKDLKQLLISRGIKNIKSIDLFDDRADLKYDMNLPVPKNEYEQYNVIFDSSLEHVFNTAQYLENSLRMVKVGGLYVLNTIINGYFGHGFYVFNPGGLTEAFVSNSYEILYKKYSTRFGEIVSEPSLNDDVLIWIVAKKKKSIDKFTIPQQGGYESVYKVPSNKVEKKMFSLSCKIKNSLKHIIYIMLGAEGVQAAGLFWRALLHRLRGKNSPSVPR